MSLNYDKLVGFLKKNPDASQKAAADSQGLTIGQVSMLKFCEAKVEAGIVSKIPGTAASIKKARQDGDRWELIAARTGKSVAAVRDAAGDVQPKPKPKAAKATTGKKGATSTRQTGKKSAATGRGRIQRNRTRRGVRNPS